MKIKRVPIKTLPPLPPELKNVIEHLEKEDQSQISRWTNEIVEWKYPRSDFFQFVAVLNRFDTILENICKEYELTQHVQKKHFDATIKQTLLSILNFTRLLFDHCSNRSLYNSYEHLNSLLYTTDIDVLETTLALLIKPAQRMSNPTAAHSNFSIQKDKVITELARSGDIISSNDTQQENKLVMSYYKEEEMGELETIEYTIVPEKENDLDLFWTLVKRHQVPSEYHFELLNKIRLTNHKNNNNITRQLLKIRFMSIVILAHTMPETTVQNRLYIYEPNLIPQIAQLVSYDNHTPTDIQTYALYALDAIARHRNKLTEVLNTLNAATNHSILLHILRQLSNGTVYSPSFLDALFTILSYLTNTAIGSQMLSSAGMITTLIHIIDSDRVQPNVLSKAVSLLHVAFDSMDNAYPSFFNFNGLEASIKALHTQTDNCINGSEHHQDSVNLVKGILRLIIRMIRTNDAGTTLRNLMETSVPDVLKKIMEHQTLFGSSIFGLAMSLYSSYVHTEPTSLSVLLEVQVPQTFLKTIKAYSGHCDAAVLLSILSVFEATCLNEQGLELFRDENPLPHFFDLICSSQFLANPMEVSQSDSVGSTAAELARHEPSLQGQMFQCIHSMLQRVIRLGESEEGKPEDNSHQLAWKTVPERNTAHKAECRLLAMIEMVARFLEGFLETDNVKEFIEYNGHEILLRYYSLPMLPFDYYLSNAFGALSDVFKMLANEDVAKIVGAIEKALRKEADRIVQPKPSQKSSVVDFIYVDGTDHQLLEKGNSVFRGFSFLVGHVGLLSSILSLFVLRKEGICEDLIMWICKRMMENPKEESLLQFLGRVHRYLIWETILLRNAVPKSWHSKEIKFNSDGTTEEIEHSDLTDPKVVNTRRLAEVLGGVSPVIMPLFQSFIQLEPIEILRLEERRRLIFIAQDVATVLLDNFKWIQDGPEYWYEYISAMAVLFSMLILDDKGERRLIAPVAVWFGLMGGIRWMIDHLVEPLWYRVEEQGDKSEGGVNRADLCLELLLPALHHLSAVNIYNDVALKELARDEPELLLVYPENWIAFLRSETFRLYRFLERPSHQKLPHFILRALLSCIKQCLITKGECRLDINVESAEAKRALEEGGLSDKQLERIRQLMEKILNPHAKKNEEDVQEDDQDENYEDIPDDDIGLSDVEAAVAVLTNTRNKVRERLPEILTQLVHERNDVDLVVRDVLVILASEDPEKTVQMMAQFFRDINKESIDKRTLFESCVNRVRVFALMLREPAVQGFASQWVSAISNFIGWSEFLDMVISTPEFPNPKWLTTLFLILETYLAQREDNPDENSTLVLEHHEATRLLSCCIQLLKLDTLSEDNLLATLRILIRLTKHRSMAQEFLAHEDGLEALLARPKRRFESHFKVQQAYVIIILRHLIETEQVVIECMREWMVAYANENPNQRTSVDKFAKRGQAAFLRSPSCFFKLVKQMYRCGINYGSSSVRFVGSMSGEDHLATIDESRKVIHFLLEELVKVQATKEESNWKLGYTGYLVECLLELVSSYPSCKQDMISFQVPKDIEFHYTPDMVPHSDRSIVYVLLNILVPYGAMNTRTDLERKKKGIYIWTTGLLVAMCYDTMHASNTKEHEERQEGDDDEHLEQENEEQPHAAEEIQQVEQESTEHQETVSTKREDVLTHVRSHVLQAIAGCFEYYTVASAKRSSKKYLKYYSLSELCHHILNARPAAINPDYIPPAGNKDANVVALSKLMLENNFVPLLVNAIQDVDVNYPHAKTILNALLRPLERLTKTATRLPPDAVHIPEIEQEGNVMNEEDQEDQEDDYRTFRRSESPVEEVDEIYRNSSLAMLDSTVVEDEEDMEGSTDESSEDEDVEMASSGEEVIEIVEEADDESSDNEAMSDDQEEEDEEDREMDELMRSHRHHLPDTDEEVDDDIEESLHEDEDDSVESYDPDDDSDLMRSDVSDNVESEDDRDWRLTTNEVPRDRPVTNDRQVGEGQDTEDIQSEAGVQSYDFSLRRRYAGGFRSRVTINTQNNLFDMPAVTMAFTAENEARLRPEYSPEKDDIILHPLLRGTNQQTINGLKEVFERDRSLSNLQPYEDIIGHGPLFMLKSIVASQAQQQKDYEEDRALEIGPTFQFTADDNAPSAAEPSKDKDDKYVLRLLLGFTPMPTIDRWTQVAQMVFIPSIIAQKTVELADRLTTILLADNQESRTEEYAEETFWSPDREQEDQEEHEEHEEQEEQEEHEEQEEQEEHEEDGVRLVIRGEEFDLTGTGLDAEFLEALPEDLRAEIISAQMEGNAPIIEVAADDGLDPEFLAALPDDIREEVLREQEEINRRRRDSNSPEPQEEEQEQEEHEEVADTSIEQTQEHVDITPPSDNQSAQPSSPLGARLSSTIRIVDRYQLAVLTRLLFVPQSIVKALLNRLLLNLCENRKVGADLMSLLLCVLQDECSDLAAVDHSFARLLHQSNEPSDHEKKKKSSGSKTPNLISQRCLEILYYVITWNWRSLRYFLSENESFGQMENGKHKYPFLVLIDLLRRPTFTNNTKLMEQLMEVLAKICRPIRSLAKNQKEKAESQSETAMMRHGILVPLIPTEHIERVVRVLTINECSSRTFRFTLSILSNFAHLEGVYDQIVDSLKLVAKQSGEQIYKDLNILLSILQKLNTGRELETSALKQFSIATSHQMKLLRILNSMYFLYNRKHNSEDQESTDKVSASGLYKELDFTSLWDMLSSCLRTIHNKEELMDVVTVLLPLVECFMVISKDYITRETTTKEKERFIAFTEEHKKILNAMIRNSPLLLNGPFSCLIHVPKILEFDNKRAFFSEALHKASASRERFPPLQLSIRRDHIFEDTYHQLQDRTGNEIRYGKLKVYFQDEEGVDEGGVSREWFSALAGQMFDPNYALFITSAADRLTYQPNRASGVNPEHLSYFKFVGRVIGKAIHDGRVLDAYFTRSFYKLILGRPVDCKDLETVDPEYYKSLVWMLDNDITNVIDLTFSVETDDFGTCKIVDLIPNGRNIAVTEANKHKYVNLIAQQKLVLAIKPQVDAFLEGFYEIIPANLIQIFNEQELELLISGLPDIDIDDWKANTVYEGYTIQSPQIQWFWRAVRSFDQEERAKLLQFATGTSKVPLGGFSALQGSNGVQKFQIHKEFGDTNRLPSAHTCFNQIDLPQYKTYEDLRRNLFKAISECSTGFGFV